MIVGFQGHGSLGRRLVEGRKMVGIHGEKVIVRAKIHTMGGFSAHAGQKDLLAWFASVAPSKPRLILTHGEEKARRTLSAEIRKRFGVSSYLPRLGEIIPL